MSALDVLHSVGTATLAEIQRTEMERRLDAADARRARRYEEWLAKRVFNTTTDRERFLKTVAERFGSEDPFVEFPTPPKPLSDAERLRRKGLQYNPIVNEF